VIESCLKSFPQWIPPEHAKTRCPWSVYSKWWSWKCILHL